MEKTTPVTKANNLPRLATVGCGYWGKNLVRNFHALGVLAAISDTNRENAAALAAEYAVPARPFNDLLADATIEALVIATPAETHAKLVGAALRADKHVFVEKPLALTLAEGQELCELAAAQGRTLMVGHLLQYHPAFLAFCDLVGKGRLGKLQYLYSNRLNLGKVRREENILWSFAPHDISMILRLVNEEPVEIQAVGANYLHEHIADVTTTHLTFPSGVEAHIFVSWLHPYKEQKLVVVGEKGMAVFDDGQPWEQKLRVYPHRIEWVEGLPSPSKADAEPIAITADEPLKRECAHFLECVLNGKTPRTDGREGLRVLRVLEAAQNSMNKGQAVKLAKRNAANFKNVMIHETATVDDPAEIGEGTKIWHYSHILSGSKIGKDCIIGQNVMIGPDVTVGNHCKIQNNVSLYTGVTLEDGVFCGPSCVFTNVKTPRAEIERKNEFLPTLAKRGATIGANATILCGTTLGEYCFIAAGAVVTKDVPPHALMAGVPATRIGWVSHAGEVLDSDLVCPREGRRYREEGPDKLVALDHG